MLGLLGGAVLAEFVGPRPVFAALAVISVLGLVFAARLPGGFGDPTRLAAPRFALPSALDLWSFVHGLTLDGLFVLGLAVLAEAALPEGAALATGAALALRYAAEILLAPLGGMAGERWGSLRLLVVLSLGCAAGFAVIGFGALWTGALVIILMRALLAPLMAPVAADASPGTARVPALARLATWRDLGAGIGPLCAGFLLPLIPAGVLYGAAALILAAMTLAAGALIAWQGRA
jgi:hypothetical protein